ncbi:MAG TPA: rhodanese-like domain-containing protein [Methylophilaceae bacterium]|jgi:rhodanese-related sulfurtransferase|nr:rhodanese-like domain-containing protein [Methylophilaceae bacterium]
MTRYQEIESIKLSELLKQGNILLVDVRTDEEAARGIIHGALHIPLHLVPLRTQELLGETPLIFYCHSGIRSAQACSFIASQGRGNIFNLRGGVLGWGAAGFTLEPKR